jgi:hypothetical protein
LKKLIVALHRRYAATSERDNEFRRPAILGLLIPGQAQQDSSKTEDVDMPGAPRRQTNGS